MNRRKPADKQKRSTHRKVDWKALEIVHQDAAGIDVGGSEHWVAISPDRDSEPVRRFGCFTRDLHEMAQWLVEKRVRSVAMQSTGVYWMPVFEVLEGHGLEVYLVNAQHTKNVPGRKSDVQECQWLLKLHAFGLLNNSFQPTDEVRIARTLWRQRGNLVAEASSAIQRIQKVLTEMNIQLSNVLTDISGVSGMTIIAAILEGERDPYELAAMVQSGVKASLEDIAKSLEGNWRKELLFVLKQHLELDQIYQQKIGDCDLESRQHLEVLNSTVDLTTQPIGPRPKGKKNSRNAPSFDLRTELYRITGIDWSQINGIDVLTAQTVITEAGADRSAFPNEKQFASWLGLCPTNEQSGGKILNRRTRKVVNRATVAFRNAASTLIRSQSYLGAQYRRLRTRLGAPKAITAMARKLACLFYRLIKHGQQYVDKGVEYYEARYREQQIRSLAKRAQKLGLQVIIPTTA
ncbi:MAG TPA: IS110 family transposase [Candidatus Angelobacter sp.]|nr:IS110 family transposase [Candidatus Angelobacter sp.]